MIVALRRAATQHDTTTQVDAAGPADHPLNASGELPKTRVRNPAYRRSGTPDPGRPKGADLHS